MVRSLDATPTVGKVSPPPGAKIASGRHFDLYVSKESERPAPAGYVERTYQVIAFAHTRKHG